MVTIEISGLDAFAKQAEASSGPVRRAAEARGAVGAERIADEMRARVAVDRGTLRATIRTEAADEGGTLIRAGGTAETLKPIRRGGVFDEALAVEYGNARTRPEPFFYGALDVHRDGVEAEMGEAADDAAGRAMT